MEKRLSMNALIPFLERLFRRRFVLNLHLILLVILGGGAWMLMPVEMHVLPELPIVTVHQSWDKTSAMVMEEKITRGIESAAYRLPGVEGVRSITKEGESTVIITFGEDEPVDARIVELREVLYEIFKPLALYAPVRIQRSVPDELKQAEWFMRYTLRFEGSSETIQHYLKTVIQPGLLSLEGMAAVELAGLPTPSIRIHLLEDSLQAFALEAADVIEAFRKGSIFAGSYGSGLQFGQNALTMRSSVGSIEELKACTLPWIKAVPVSDHRTTQQGYPPLRLDQIADVRVAEHAPSILYRRNGKPAYGIYLYKIPGFDALTLSKNVQSTLKRLREELPEGMQLTLEADVAQTLQQQLDQLQQQALLSVSLVIFCLWVAYKRWEAPIIVFSCILVTLSTTVLGMYILQLSIHRVTLSALMISIGLIVDNAILVYDQFHRIEARPGFTVVQRLQALMELVTPIIGSTLTTVVIVLPLMFSMGSISSYLSPLVLTLSLALIVSAAVALVLIPHLLKWVSIEAPKQNRTRVALNPFKTLPIWNSLAYVKPGYPILRFRKWKRRFDTWVWEYYVWRRRYRHVVLTSLVLVLGIPVYLIPEPDPGTVTSSQRTPGFGSVHQEQAFKPIDKALKLPVWMQGYFDYRSLIDPWIGGLGYIFFSRTFFGQLPEQTEQDHLQISIHPPLGTPIERLDQITSSFENLILSYAQVLDQFETRVTENDGSRITIRLQDPYVHHSMSYTLKNELMQRAASTGNFRISIHGLGEGYLSPTSQTTASFWIRIRGFAFDELMRQAAALKYTLEKHPKVRHVETHQAWQLTDRGWHYVMELDAEAMLYYQLRRASLLKNIEDQIQPRFIPLGRLTMGLKTLPVLLYTPARTPYVEDFLSWRHQAPIPYTLNRVATIRKEQVMPRIEKENQSYSLVLGVDFMGSYAQGHNVVSKLVQRFPQTPGFLIEHILQEELPDKQDKGLNVLGTLLLAIGCVWMVVAALFNDLNASFKVLGALPLSALGIMSGVLVHQIPFDRGALAGTLLCVGIVVNNSILLVYRNKEYQSRGIFGYRAWIQTYRSSLRSILLTSGTTLLGLVPVLIWGESGFWYHMAVVVSWGLAYSVALLLAFSGMMTR